MSEQYAPTKSALPWKIGADRNVYDASGHFVTVAGFHFTVAGGSYIPSNLNTEFIVRACNAHDQLVEALRDAIEIIRSIDQTDNTCDARIDVSEFRAALAAAGAA